MSRKHDNEINEIKKFLEDSPPFDVTQSITVDSIMAELEQSKASNYETKSAIDSKNVVAVDPKNANNVASNKPRKADKNIFIDDKSANKTSQKHKKLEEVEQVASIENNVHTDASKQTDDVEQNSKQNKKQSKQTKTGNDTESSENVSKIVRHNELEEIAEVKKASDKTRKKWFNRSKSQKEVEQEPSNSEIMELDEEEFKKMFGHAFDNIKDSVKADNDELFENKPAKVKKESGITRVVKHIKKEVPTDNLTPKRAYEKLLPFSASLQFRSIMAIVFFIPMAYMTLAVHWKLPIPEIFVYTIHPYSYLFVSLFLLILVMSCGIDMIAKGFSDFYRLRPNTESLIVVSCIASIANIASIAIAPTEFIGYLPSSVISAGSVAFSLLGQNHLFHARKVTYKTLADAKTSTAIVRSERIYDDLPGFSKQEDTLEGFVYRTELPDNYRKFMSYFTPILLIASLLFAVIVSFGQKRPENFFWAWGAISSVTVPFSSLFVFSLPFSRIADRLAHMGGAIAGWSAARTLSHGAFVVTTNTDIFPSGTAVMNGRKTIGKHSTEKVGTYAAALLEASGSILHQPMVDAYHIPKDNAVKLLNFEHYDGGGIGGDIDNCRVLLGTATFMKRMGISLPSELNLKNAMFISINLEIVGIFAINYIQTNGVENALHLLFRQKLTPVLAVIDFNISPNVIKEKYKVNPDLLEYPPAEERIRLALENRLNTKPTAFVVKEGLSPFAECIVGAMRLNRIARINLMINMLATFSAVLMMFYFTYVASSATALAAMPVNILYYMFIWFIPVWMISSATNRY